MVTFIMILNINAECYFDIYYHMAYYIIRALITVLLGGKMYNYFHDTFSSECQYELTIQNVIYFGRSHISDTYWLQTITYFTGIFKLL